MTQMTVTSTAPAQAPAAAPPAAPAATAPVAPVAAPAATAVPAVVETTIDAAPAPVAAPVAPVAPAATEPAKPGAAIEYNPSGDPGLDLALSFLGKQGFAPDHPAMKAAETGDFALLKAELALKGDKAQGWEAVIALGEQAYGKVLEARKAASAATQDSILSAFGADKVAAAAEWAKVQAWAKTNAEPAERAAVNAALAAGGIAAKAMASYLNGLYRQHPSAVIEPAVVTKIGGTATNNAGALTAAQYQAELSKLRSAKGNNIDSLPEYKALQARRMAYRK